MKWTFLMKVLLSHRLKPVAKAPLGGGLFCGRIRELTNLEAS